MSSTAVREFGETRGAQVRKLLEYRTPASLRHAHGNGAVPPWFQLVMRARFQSQTPIAIGMAAFHPLK